MSANIYQHLRLSRSPSLADVPLEFAATSSLLLAGIGETGPYKHHIVIWQSINTSPTKTSATAADVVAAITARWAMNIQNRFTNMDERPINSPPLGLSFAAGQLPAGWGCSG